MSIDWSTKAAIRAAAVELRRKHDALDWNANIDHLLERSGLAQGRYSPYLGTGWSFIDFVKNTNKRVKALLSVKENVVLLATDIHQAREAFAKGHELGHSALPWHREILYVCDEHDLATDTRAQMEWEANTFSSEVLFPEPLLPSIYRLYPTSMETVLQLRSLTQVSIESCAVTYVGNHPRRCVLLILENSKAADGEPQLKVARKVVSPSASRSVLGTLDKGYIFSKHHVLYTHSRGDSVSTTQVAFKNPGNGPPRYEVSLLNNQYRVLALLFEGE